MMEGMNGCSFAPKFKLEHDALKSSQLNRLRMKYA